MPTIKLTERGITSLQPIAGKRAEYFDTNVRGLALRITEHGAKSWAVLYRVPAGKSESGQTKWRLRRLTLGGLDVLGLADARDRARDALQQVRDGIDPATEKQHERQGETVADLVRDYIEKYAKPRKRSWREDDRILRSYVLTEWKARQISDIKRRDVRVLVEDIAARGARVMSNRVLATVRKMFSFAVEQDLIENNPAARLGRPGGAETSRDRVLTEEEIRKMWAAFSALAPEMGAYFKLRLVTAQRGKEVASMRWRDVDFDAGWWTIPHSVAKNGLGHRVPLSPTAIAIIESLKHESAEPDTFVLVGARGRRQQTQAAATFRIADFRGHDLRRTAASMMASGGISRLTISKILNHVEKGITAVYDRHSYDAEKQAALGWWDKKLRVVLENRPAGTNSILAVNLRGQSTVNQPSRQIPIIVPSQHTTCIDWLVSAV